MGSGNEFSERRIGCGSGRIGYRYYRTRDKPIIGSQGVSEAAEGIVR